MLTYDVLYLAMQGCSTFGQCGKVLTAVQTALGDGTITKVEAHELASRAVEHAQRCINRDLL